MVTSVVLTDVDEHALTYDGYVMCGVVTVLHLYLSTTYIEYIVLMNIVIMVS